MAKECVICGRPIKTGRKYCWEHRHSAQADSVRGEKLIREAEDKLIKIHGKSLFKFMKEHKHPEYVEFIKDYIRKKKEEKEFTKSLLK